MEETVMIVGMEPRVVHISEEDLAKDLRSILQHVQTGAELIIERDAQPVAVIRPAEPVRRKISECIALRAGQIDGQSHAMGIRIPLSDLLIGTSALELSDGVGTANVLHFQLIPGLNVIKP